MCVYTYIYICVCICQGYEFNDKDTCKWEFIALGVRIWRQKTSDYDV